MALSDVQPDERDVSDEGRERERLVALRRYGVLDSPAEAAFDDLTRLAAAIFEVPIAVINLIDATRQWFKSEIGFGTCETPLEMSICRHAMLQRSLLVVPDLREDARFADNPQVKGKPGLRAYAGAPLATADGHVLGMLCVLDLKPRIFSNFQVDALQTLARQVMALLELRRSEAQAKAQRAQLEEQELQWQAALMSAQLGAWRLDFATQAVSVNASFASVLGLPPETREFDAPRFMQLTHPDDQAKVAALAEEALQRHEPLEGEYRILRQDDGSIRWLLTRSQVVRDAEGRPVAMLGGNVDITERKLAEHALATSEQRLRLAVEAAGLFSWEIDAATRQVVVPQNYLAAIGRARVSLDLPTLLDEVVHPDDLVRVRATFERAFADHAPLRFECRSLSADGQTLHLLHTGAWVHDENGAPRALVAVSQDITEETRQTERDAYRLHLTDALRPLADAAAIQQAAAQALGEHFGAWLTCYTQVEDDQRHAVVLSDWQAPGVPSLVGRHDLEMYGPAFADETRADRTLAVEDTESAPQLSEGMRANYALLGVRATAIVPLFKGGRMVGQCVVCMHAPYRWRPDELALIEETAGRTWAALERARAEDGLRASEEKYRTLFDTMKEGFAVCDLIRDADGRGVDWRFVEINQAWERQTGVDRAIAIGTTAAAVMPGMEPFWGETFARVVDSGEPEQVEHYATPIDRWSHASIYPRGSEQFVVVYDDISVRKRAETALAESEQKYRSLFDSMDQAYCIFEMLYEGGVPVNWRYIATNPAFEKDTGMCNAVGRTILDFAPDIERKWIEVYARVAETGESTQFEESSLAFDGNIFVCNAFSVGRLEEHKVGVLFSNITERKRVETALQESKELQGFLLRLSDALRRLYDPIAIQEEASRLVGEYLSGDRVFYSEINEAAGTLTSARNFVRGDVQPVHGPFPLSDFDWLWSLMENGTTVMMEKVTSSPLIPDEHRAMLEAIEIAAFITVPLVKQGRTVALFSISMASPRMWTSAEVALMNDVAERTWAALEQARAEAALRSAERDYRTLFIGTPTPFLLLAPDPAHFTIVEVNDAYLAATMRTREGLIGRPLFEAFPDKSAEATSTQIRTLRTSLEHALSSKRTDVLSRFKYEIARPDGSFEERWWNPLNTPLLDDHGVVVALLHHATDVTQLHLAEIAERENQERQAFLLKLSDALRPLSDAVGIQSEATRLLREHFEAGWCYYAEFDASGTAVQILRDSVREGLPSLVGHHEMQDLPELLAHLSAGELMNAPDLSAFPYFNKRVVDRYTAFGMHSFVSTPLLKHGRLLAFLMLADTRTRHWNDDAIGLLAEVGERTWAAVERAQTEAALRTSELALRDADRRKDEFLATLAHELRNPLAPVRNSLHILRLVGADVARQAPLIDMMERQLGHMVRLVDDLMEVSRITRGKIELQRRTLDLADVLRSAAETVGPQMQAARVTLHLELPHEALLVEADAVRLAQIFANLLHNAAKYTDAGGQVTVALSSEDGQAVAAVRDSGTGIPAEMLPRVFELFTQVDRTLGRAQGGLGIGLALVKNLVGLHGGSVEARSDGPGLGSEFTVRLPLAAAAPAADEAATGPTADAHWLAGRRVLVVDDNRDAADSLAALLAYFGADARTAYDGPAALLAASEQRPEAVLLDLGMPGMDGYAVAARLRSEPHYQAMKLIALTGWGQQEDLQRTRAAGFDEHLVKPVAPEQVLELLRPATTEGKHVRGLPEPDTAPTA